MASGKDDNSSDSNDRTKSKVVFPTWKSLLVESVNTGLSKNPEIFNTKNVNFNLIFDKLDLVEEVVSTENPANLIVFLAELDSSYQPRLSLEEVSERFKNISVRPNEFYAVFDLYKFMHQEVDENITNILGLKPEEFTLQAMAGLDPTNPLFHERDNNHVLRWASIAYFMYTINLFKWNSMEDQYRVRFRVGTKKSSINLIREQNYVSLEKLCFLFHDTMPNGTSKPIYHFDKWLVHDKSEFDFVRPMWLSKPERQVHLNSFLYLVNAYLLQIQPQHLILLHERCTHDRNKAIAIEINDRIFAHTAIVSDIDEHQVSDCFSKTLRNKISYTINIWDKRSPQDLENVVGDAHAVKIGKTLGLLPIPEPILELIYNNVTES